MMNANGYGNPLSLSDVSLSFLNLYSRPAFLPDPNDGSLYSLGGKNKEGLTVSRNTPLPLLERNAFWFPILQKNMSPHHTSVYKSC